MIVPEHVHVYCTYALTRDMPMAAISPAAMETAVCSPSMSSESLGKELTRPVWREREREREREMEKMGRREGERSNTIFTPTYNSHVLQQMEER